MTRNSILQLERTSSKIQKTTDIQQIKHLLNDFKKFDSRGNFIPSLFNLNNDFFTNFFNGNELSAVNISVNEKEFKVELSVPGFDKNDFKLEIEKNVLTISANKEVNKEEKDENEKVIRREFSSSSFSRSFVLPKNIDTENISAEQKDGILKISLPKLEKAPEDKVKKLRLDDYPNYWHKI